MKRKHHGEKRRHASTILDKITINAKHIEAQITDYEPSRGSVIARAIWLNEASQHMSLKPDIAQYLDELRQEVAIAVGIVVK